MSWHSRHLSTVSPSKFRSRYFSDALGIYLLNLLLAFLQPKFDPSLEADLQADEIEEGMDAIPSLPSQKDDEFRPFVRRLPEWNFWLSSTRAIFIATVCTIFEAFDVPVYWPILVLYFCILFTLTMRRQIQYVFQISYASQQSLISTI